MWTRARAEAEKQQSDPEYGSLALDLLGPAPLLGRLDDAARHCWNFCGGWAPERWAVYDALHLVADWHLLIDVMSVLKEAQ